jgi:hypothetical protein
MINGKKSGLPKGHCGTMLSSPHESADRSNFRFNGGGGDGAIAWADREDGMGMPIDMIRIWNPQQKNAPRKGGAKGAMTMQVLAQHEPRAQ